MLSNSLVAHILIGEPVSTSPEYALTLPPRQAPGARRQRKRDFSATGARRYRSATERPYPATANLMANRTARTSTAGEASDTLPERIFASA
jgi:hypothetical protein